MAETQKPESDVNFLHHLKGHLGNLSTEQEQALTAFKENLTAVGLYTPAESEGKAASHDDATLL